MKPSLACGRVLPLVFHHELDEVQFAQHRTRHHDSEDVTDAPDKACAHGVRGGTVDDYVHLAGIPHMHREGDAEIRHP